MTTDEALRQAFGGGRGNKYRNVKAECRFGHKHDSRKEAMRCEYLTYREKAGEITELAQQQSFAIHVNKMLVCRYVADFCYQENGAYVVEDAKGIRTRMYDLKKKLMMACHGIEIVEV